MTLRMKLGWETALLSGFLLLHLAALSAGGDSLVFNTTQFNSSNSASNGFRLKSAFSGEATSISLAQVRTHKPQAVEELGSGGLSENSPSTSATVAINADSAEREHLIGVAIGGMGASLPTLSGSRPHGTAQLDFKDEDIDDSAPHWQSEILQPDGSTLDLDRHQPSTPAPSEDPSNSASQPDSSHVIRVGLYEPVEHHQIDTPPPPQLQELQGGDPTSWTLSDFYDYLSPDYSTTEGYPDEDQPTPVDMEDENVRMVTKAAPSNSRPFTIDDGASGGYDLTGPAGAVDGEDSSGCLLGFIRRNGTCQSPCDIYISYCFNGGQCYVVDGIGAFCRCNMQDYIWNKGTRCESVITEFQVMCIVVGGASLVLLLLFMVIVFFSKRLHLLKIENRRLRKRSKYRPQSEQHNDNFSLSTIAEGSQANKTMSKYIWEYKPNEEHGGEDDTAKLEEPVKSPTKEDESLNIQNSLTPKHENNKASGEENAEEGGVTIDLELLLPKEAKTHPETSPPLHYNVFLYKLPKSPKKSPVLRRPPGRSGQARSLSQLCPRRGSEPGYSPISTRSLPPMPSRTPNPHMGKACTP